MNRPPRNSADVPAASPTDTYSPQPETVEIGHADRAPALGTYQPPPPYETHKLSRAKPSPKMSPKLKQMLADLTPEQREQAIQITAKLLIAKARRQS